MAFNWITERNVNGTEIKFFRYDTQYGKDTGIEYLAKRLDNGKFSVFTHDGDYLVPYSGSFENYREMDEYAESMLEVFPDGYVCHVDHNDEDAYVLMLPKTSYYIRVE